MQRYVRPFISPNVCSPIYLYIACTYISFFIALFFLLLFTFLCVKNYILSINFKCFVLFYFVRFIRMRCGSLHPSILYPLVVRFLFFWWIERKRFTKCANFYKCENAIALSVFQMLFLLLRLPPPFSTTTRCLWHTCCSRCCTYTCTHTHAHIINSQQH